MQKLIVINIFRRFIKIQYAEAINVKNIHSIFAQYVQIKNNQNMTWTIRFENKSIQVSFKKNQ